MENAQHIRRLHAARGGGAVIDAASEAPAPERKTMSPEEEVKQWDALQQALAEVAKQSKYPEIVAALNVIRKTNPSRVERCLTIEVLLDSLLEQLGHSKRKRGTIQTDAKVYYPVELLSVVYDTVNKVHDYFKDVGKVGWHENALRHIADDLLVVTDQPKASGPGPLWRFSDYAERLEFANRIAKQTEIENFENRKQAVVDVIASGLRGNIDRGYYSETDPNARENAKYHIIESLAKQYDVVLPTERELFEKDIAGALQRVDQTIAALSNSDSTSLPTDPAVKDAESAIAKAQLIIFEAQRRGYTDLIVPEKYSQLQSVQDVMQKAFQEARSRTIQGAYARSLDSFRSKLDRSPATSNFQTGLEGLIQIAKRNNDIISMEVVRKDIGLVADEVNSRIHALHNLLPGMRGEERDAQLRKYLLLAEIQDLFEKTLEGLSSSPKA